jgi:hypothetical protein
MICDACLRNALLPAWKSLRWQFLCNIKLHVPQFAILDDCVHVVQFSSLFFFPQNFVSSHVMSRVMPVDGKFT